MTALEIIQKAIDDAENDPHGGKVLLTTAEAVTIRDDLIAQAEIDRLAMDLSQSRRP